MKKLFLLLTSLILMWSNVYADYDYEYAFNYETDYASGGCIWVNNSADFGIMNIFMMKNYVSTNNVGYPAIRIDILDNQYTSAYMAVEGDYTTLTNTINAQNCGKIINSTTAGGNNVFTAFWDASGTKHTFQSVTVSVRGDDEHPFFALYGTCTDGKTVYATIGFVPGDAEAIYENLTGKSYSANNISTKKDGSTITLKATCSGSSTISGYKFTVNETIQLAFRGTTTSYIPTKSDYKINPSNQFGSIYPNLDATDDASESIISQYLTNTSYSFWNYYLVTHGIVQVLNPNCLDKPMYVKINQIQNIPQGSADITIGSIPTLRILTVSTAGTGANGSASISCAEGHGYPSGGFLAGNSGNYYYDGTTVTLVAPDAQDGYRFTKWTKNGTQQSTSASYSLGNVSSTNSGAYVANFEGNTYKVVFNGNDNTGGSMSNQTGFKYGTGKDLTSNAFSRVYTVTYNYHDAESGNGTASNDATYTFNGWNTAANGSGTSYTNGYSLSTPSPIPSHNGTVNLYAQWNSASVTLPSPEKTGHNFLGWYTEETGGTRVGGAGDSYTPTAGITLHAQWQINTYTVTIAVDETNNYGTVSATSITAVPYGAAITVNDNAITINSTTVTANPTSPNTAQYTYGFGSWKIGSTTLVGGETVTEAITIKANFTRETNTYDITFKNADGTTLKKLDGTTDAVYTVAYGETPVYDGATPTKTADDAYTYTFNGWDNEIVAVTGTATYTAMYMANPKSYTLTWTTDGDALTGTYTSGSTAYGTTIVQPNTPTKASTVQYAYTFNGWDPTPAEKMPAATTEYTATWTQTLRQYALNVAAGANGTVSGGGTYDYGTEHNITATPNTNYHFVQWQDGNTDNPRTITIDENTPNVTYTATFEIDGTPEIVLEEDGTATDNGVATTYAALLAKYGEGAAGGAKAVNVTINRSMSAGQWNTIALPFDVDPDTEYTEWDGHIFDMSNSTATTASMDIYFERIMDIIEAGKPYLFLVGDTIKSMRFEGKILKTFTTQSYTAQSGDVSFHSVFTPTEYVKDKSYIFLINNRLYYPNQTSGTRARSFRAYFRILNDVEYTAPVRIRIADTGETITMDETEQEIETKKYVEDGILIIERGGVRYDAQGKRME